jgi:hypothetical protein
LICRLLVSWHKNQGGGGNYPKNGIEMLPHVMLMKGEDALALRSEFSTFCLHADIYRRQLRRHCCCYEKLLLA